MRFKSEIERLSHPQAALIPEPLWHELEIFSRKLTQTELQIMQNADLVLPVDPITIESKRVNACWCAAVISHPDAPVQALLDLGRTLLLDPSELFILAVSLGRIDLLSAIDQQHPDIFPDYFADAIQTSLYKEQQSACQWLLERAFKHLHINQFQITELLNKNLIIGACANTPLEMFKWLYNNIYSKLPEAQRGFLVLAFNGAIATGDILKLDWLLTNVADKLPDIAVINYAVFQSVNRNMLSAINWLIAQIPAEAAEKWHHHPQTITHLWQHAAETGQIEVIDWLITRQIMPAKMEVILQAAIQSGHLSVLKRLVEISGDQVDALLSVCHQAITAAIVNNHIEILQWFADNFPKQLELTLKEQERAPVYIQQCKQQTVTWLIRNIPVHNLQEAIISIFSKGGPSFESVEKLKWLAEQVDVTRRNELCSNDIIQEAFRCHDLIKLKWLKQTVPNEFNAFINSDAMPQVFYQAVVADVDVLEWIGSQLSAEQLQKCVQHEKYYSFILASSNGKLASLQWLARHAPLADMIRVKWVKHFAPIHAALESESGNMRTLFWIALNAPAQLRELTANLNAYQAALNQAIEWNNLSAFKWLVALAPEKLPDLIALNQYQLFSKAVRQNKNSFINYLLGVPTCFAYVEMHISEYSEHIYKYIKHKLGSLFKRKAMYEREHPNGVFDLQDPSEVKLYFYIVRHFIRRNNPAYHDTIRTLLAIPAIKNMAHQGVSTQNENELIRLAITIGNDGAARILLNIPAVFERAAANDFYSAEASGQLNLRELAADDESSMHALTQQEQHRLKRARDVYTPTIKQKTVRVLMDELRQQLKDRYHLKPASIVMDNGKLLLLPFDLNEFVKLILSRSELSENDVMRALSAYYKDDNHTAWRYMAIPNPLMSADVNHDLVEWLDEAERQGYSTFEEYQSLIVMLWLAAQDENYPPTEDHTLAFRLTNFIKELALIGRAHNWDKTRINASDHEEEYDDYLEGDKPSCFSGVKRRLFQSVIGHELLQILTLDIINQELHSFLRSHFAAHINDQNKSTLLNAYQEAVANLDTVAAEPLKMLDVSEQNQHAFLQEMQKKYGVQLSCTLVAHIQKQFKLNQTKELADYAHALRFGYVVESLLKPTLAQVGMFGGKRARPEDPDEAHLTKDRKLAH